MMPDYNQQYAELAARKLSAEDLAFKGRCHRCETVSGTGRDRVTRYRTDIRCNAGSFEEPVWHRLIEDLSVRSGEENLLGSLLEYVTQTHHFLHTKVERKKYAFELYSVRIFDNKEWVGYLDFNRKYRTEVLKGIAVVEIEAECCETPAVTTKARIQLDRRIAPGATHCPICGRWTPYRMIREYSLTEGDIEL